MAAQFFNRLGQLGLGIAITGGVINSALYNGIFVILTFVIYT
jgi:prohibitin 1